MRSAPTATETLLLATERYLALATDEAPAPAEAEEAPDARSERGPVTVEAWAAQRAGAPVGEIEVAVRIAIEAGWHINALEPLQDYLVATEVEPAVGAPYLVHEVAWPEAETIEPGFSEDPLAVYEGEVWVLARVKVRPDAPEGPAPLLLARTAQPCDDASCGRPERHMLELPLRLVQDAPAERRHQPIFERFRP